MSIPKHAIDNNANKFGRIAGNSPLLRPLFKNTADPPKNLYYRGDVNLLNNSYIRIAIVGSRKVTPYGKQVTSQLGIDLANRGIILVSGLAIGVDSLAHQAALEARTPTIAVLPSDVDHFYPRSHLYLAQQILQKGGLIVSEYAESAQPQKFQFIARNRIIAGIATAVLITEAAQGSGSLHTAGFALEQGKPVMAVPGPINTTSSTGANRLIQTGAAMITSLDDIGEVLNFDTHTSRSSTVHHSENPHEATVLSLLKSGISDGTVLLAQSGLSAAQFNQALTMLEIMGKIRALGAGEWTIR